MPEINTPTPNERDVPVFQPGMPTPEDPRQESPMRDPPVDPEHDVDEKPPVKQAGGVKATDPSPDRVLYDENKTPG
jgi:hypothetical protein